MSFLKSMGAESLLGDVQRMDKRQVKTNFEILQIKPRLYI